uniref:Thioredoxin domain-containing protein n=1 Tax=Panagrellus redivivus TaxID=6233 RepID=A0A7E4V3C4_PANRE
MKTWPQKLLRFFLLMLVGIILSASGNIVNLNMGNLDATLKGSQVVFVAFCADWCPFSRRLKPVWEQAAAKWTQDRPGTSVAWAIVDSVQQADVADKYFVNKYPTMKIFINGELISKEYRSTRSVEALIEFVDEQLKTAIIDFPNTDFLAASIDREKRNVVGYIADRNSVEYANFQKIGALLREDCFFYSATDDALKSVNGNTLVFKDPGTDDEQKYTGSFTDYEFMKQWLTDKCIPLVREVTFENVEELTEEGLPFLIFFRDPKDKDSDKLFTELVTRELYDQKAAVNALLADGHKFAHPLRHLGKTAKDLPVLAIDSFQHMFLFPNMAELDQVGKLRQFVLDLHSGKLHKEFHENLDSRIAELQKLALEQQEQDNNPNSGEARAPAAMPPADTTPKPSIFKELKPSNKRYSLLSKTEL